MVRSWCRNAAPPRGMPPDAPRRSGDRPCCGSSGAPWLTCAEDGVEDGEEASHAGDDGDHLRASPGGELGVAGAEDRVPADGGERGHEEDVADGGSAARDGPVAAHGPAVAVDGGDTDEGGGLAPVEAPEFGHL